MIRKIYSIAKNPEDKLWYALGTVGGGVWLTVSSGYKTKKEAKAFIKKQPLADKAAKNELSD